MQDLTTYVKKWHEKLLQTHSQRESHTYSPILIILTSIIQTDQKATRLMREEIIQAFSRTKHKGEEGDDKDIEYETAIFPQCNIHVLFKVCTMAEAPDELWSMHLLHGL